jgi:DegV family protein with EDD domain
MLRESPEHPATAAPSPGAYAAAFADLAGYRRVFVLPVSSGVSASHRAALVAADGDPRVRVLDGRSVSVGTLLLADGIQRRLADGATSDELEAWVEAARDRLQLLIAVDTLEFLRRGGRIGPVRQLAGTALGVRPLLTLRDGELASAGRAHGRRAVWRAFERFVAGYAPGADDVRAVIAHADCPDAADRLAGIVRETRPAVSLDRICELGAVVGAHGGPGTFGLGLLSAAAP